MSASVCGVTLIRWQVLVSLFRWRMISRRWRMRWITWQPTWRQSRSSVAASVTRYRTDVSRLHSCLASILYSRRSPYCHAYQQYINDNSGFIDMCICICRSSACSVELMIVCYWSEMEAFVWVTVRVILVQCQQLCQLTDWHLVYCLSNALHSSSGQNIKSPGVSGLRFPMSGQSVKNFKWP